MRSEEDRPVGLTVLGLEEDALGVSFGLCWALEVFEDEPGAG